MSDGLRGPFVAIRRAKVCVLTIAVTYALSVAIGIAMASAGNDIALERRDAIVDGARSSETLMADRSGDHARAALLDFASNLEASVVGAITGITVVGAYPIVAYRGWVGGIVSMDAGHRSRLGGVGSATYYVVTLILQLIPYSIADGMGVYVGVAAWRAVRRPQAGTWLGLPMDRLRDAALAYVAIVPLFLVASLWEFLAR